MAWLHRASESIHKTGRPQTPRKLPRLAGVGTASALAALFAVASCTAPPASHPSQSTTTAPAASASGSPQPPQTASAPQTASPRDGAPTPAQSTAAPALKETRALGWGPQQRDADAAAAALAKMTLEEKAGQVILPFYAGLDSEAQAATVERLYLAGSMIMADNAPGTAAGLVDVPALAGVTRRLDKASRAGGRTWPGLIGVDQEGGAVSRVGAPLTRWPTPMSYGAAGSVPLAAEAGTGLAVELAPLGFTV